MKKNKKLEAIRKNTPMEVKLMIDHSFAIVDRLNEIMTRKKISQRQLAERLGKRESEVSKWMRGTHNFTIKTIAKLEAVLGEPVFQTATKAPVIHVINVKNESDHRQLIVRGVRGLGIPTRSYSVRAFSDSVLVSEPMEQYN